MAASPQVITNNPLYLNGRTYVYTAQELRKIWGDNIGQGVLDYDSFRVRQRAAGATMSVDCMTASVLNRAFIRGTVVADQGVYRVDFTNSTVVNLDIAASDPTNPRIDSVYLCVEDQQHTGANDRATVRIVTGTPTGGATVVNRTGAGAAPSSMSSMLIADILVPAGSGSVVDANIEDRRAFAQNGTPPPTLSLIDQVCFLPAAGCNTGVGLMQSTASFNSYQAAALCYLPRKIAGVTKIRFPHVQGATANVVNPGFVLSIFDASGRVIVSTAATQYGGTAGNTVANALTIASTGFDAGEYYVFVGNAAGTASGSVTTYGILTGNTAALVGPSGPNLAVYFTSGGATVPTTFAGCTDAFASATGTLKPTVPLVTLATA